MNFQNILASALCWIALSFSTAQPALAFLGGGGISGAAIEGAIREEGDQTQERIENNMRVHEQTLRQLGGQISNQFRALLGADSRMRQLQDERQRQMRIEDARFEAKQRVENTRLECEIITRSRSTRDFNTPEQTVSEQTLRTLEQMAAYDVGEPVGGSGDPVETTGVNQKATLQQRNVGQQFCDPARVKNGVCPQPAPEEMQGMDYIPSKGFLKEISYKDPAVFQSCSAFSMHATGVPFEDLEQSATENGQGDGMDTARFYSKLSRKNLAAATIMSYCARREPQEARDGTSASILMKEVEEGAIGAYSASDFPRGLSYLAHFQLMSQKWFSTNSMEDLEINSETQGLKKVYSVLGWIAHQNNRIYKTLDKMTLLQATQLGIASESLDQDRLNTENIISAIQANP